MPTATVTDNDITLLKAGVATGTAKSGAAWALSDALDSFGGAADLWGASWTPADINSATFGVQLSATSGGAIGASVDYVQITVSYTDSSGHHMMTLGVGA